jgi:hypothetical protein
MTVIETILTPWQSLGRGVLTLSAHLGLGWRIAVLPGIISGLAAVLFLTRPMPAISGARAALLLRRES